MEIMLIGNNLDRASQRQVDVEMGRGLAAQHAMRFFETSPRDNTNVEEAFLQLTEDILECTPGGTPGGSRGCNVPRRLDMKLRRHRLYRVQLTWMLCRQFALSRTLQPRDGLARCMLKLPSHLFESVVQMLDLGQPSEAEVAAWQARSHAEVMAHHTHRSELQKAHVAAAGTKRGCSVQ